MFYEEKCTEGCWYWRRTPDGEWLKFSYLALQNKLNEILARMLKETPL